jgi:hypothetical protein
VFELSPGGIISVATTLEYRPGFILPWTVFFSGFFLMPVQTNFVIVSSSRWLPSPSNIYLVNIHDVTLGGLVVSFLVIGPKVRGFKHGREDKF